MKKNFDWKLALIIVAVVIALIGAMVGWFFGVQNSAIEIENQIVESQENIAAQEKRRADLIPALANSVKSYNKHEYNLIVDAIKARDLNTDKGVEEAKLAISAIMEKYPESKSSELYKNFNIEMSQTENLIVNQRKNYNEWRREYRSYIARFPHKQILSMLGYEIKEYETIQYNPKDLEAPTNVWAE